MLSIGLIGCGALGSALARLVNEGKAGDVSIVALYDKVDSKCFDLSSKFGHAPIVARSLEEFFSVPVMSLVVEAASQEAVDEYGESVLNSGRDLLVMSTGALLDGALRQRLYQAAWRADRKIFVPSGAIFGIDGLKAASLGRVKSVELVTRKPPKALGLRGLKKAKTVFSGSAEEAVKKFPRNINVSATISLAGTGGAKTTVKLVADPKVKNNTHEMTVRGDFGTLFSRAENRPLAENPKTSYLAALSAVQLLKQLSHPIRIGT